MNRAVIFDVDGTLVDTVDFHAEAWQRSLAHFGHDVSYEDVRSQIGKGGDQFLPVFISQVEIENSGEDIENFRASLFRREYMPKIRGFPCVRELFVELRNFGLKTSLASSAKGDELSSYKKAARIEDLVDTETSSDDVQRSKPNPDIFLAALGSLYLHPDDAIVVGDTPYDAEAARLAGLRMIALRCGGFPEAGLRAAGAIEVYDDCADLLRNLKDSAISDWRS